RDVVQVTEGVLQFLQSCHETFPSPHSLLARKGAAKEFRGVPEFLGLNAHLMSTLWVELVELCTRFQNLLPASPQLVGGSTDNRLLSQQAVEVVGAAGPVAGLKDLDTREERAVETIARRQPVGGDLRQIIGILRIANEIERIGDLAKNIGKRIV